jgi:guanylate kinase
MEYKMDEAIFSKDLVQVQPLMVIISGPSGVGKDSVVKLLIRRDPSLHFIVTMASRSPRPGEVDGVDYFFVSKEKFEKMISEDDFIEYAVVYEEYKGVPKQQVRAALKSGNDMILRLDVQGAARFRSLFPQAILIFLVPENDQAWLEQLQSRKSETPETLKVRIRTAREELECIDQFDYIVVNAHNQLDKTVDDILAIIDAEHHRVEHRKITL